MLVDLLGSDGIIAGAALVCCGLLVLIEGGGDVEENIKAFFVLTALGLFLAVGVGLLIYA